MEDTKTIVLAGESETVEFKETWNDAQVLKALAALANTRGGTLLIGVCDDGSVRGVSCNTHQLDAWTNCIVDSLRLHPTRLGLDTVDGKDVFRIDVEQAATPVAHRARYYRRVGATTRPVLPHELTRFLFDRVGLTWESRPISETNTNVSDLIDSEKLAQFVAESRERLPGIDRTLAVGGMEAVLEKLHLSDEEEVSRAAVLLFGNDPQKVNPNAVIKIGRFKTNTIILDHRQFGGTLFDQAEHAMRQIMQYIQARIAIPGTSDWPIRNPDRPAGLAGIRDLIKSHEIWDYPLPSLREAIINALIHRDYSVHSSTDIRVYDDHIVIDNPGELPFALTVAELEKEHKSIRLNPNLAQAFYHVKLIELWGSGTLRMIDECNEHGLPPPIFRSSGGIFKVIFCKNAEAFGRLRKDRASIPVPPGLDDYTVSASDKAPIFV